MSDLITADTNADYLTPPELAHIGMTALGVAHDLGNELQVVQGAISIIREDPSRADLQNAAALLEGVVGRAGCAISRLCGRAQPGGTTKLLEPKAFLTGMGELLSGSILRGVSIEVTSNTGLYCVEADEAELQCVLLNLAINAGHAMVTSPKLLKLVASLQFAPVGAEQRVGTQSHFVRIDAIDNGIGMSPETLAAAVTPFFSTRSSSTGMGMGLTLAHDFADKSGGMFTLESRLGAGATVSIWLPATLPTERLPETADIQAGGATSFPMTGLRALLVDDINPVRAALARQLKRDGVIVDDYAAPDLALAALQSGQHFDLLITDFTMPGISGEVLVKEAHRLLPLLSVVILSGEMTEATAFLSDYPWAAQVVLMAKPIPRSAMRRAILELLQAVAPQNLSDPINIQQANSPAIAHTTSRKKHG